MGELRRSGNYMGELRRSSNQWTGHKGIYLEKSNRPLSHRADGSVFSTPPLMKNETGARSGGRMTRRWDLQIDDDTEGAKQGAVPKWTSDPTYVPTWSGGNRSPSQTRPEAERGNLSGRGFSSSVDGWIPRYCYWNGALFRI